MSLSMLNHSVASMARIPGGKYHDIKEKVWGIKLTKDKPESTWKPEVDIVGRAQICNACHYIHCYMSLICQC